jgi:ribosomal protein S18 acetylase RimI-like enzyme
VEIIIGPASVADAGELLTVQRAAYLSEGRLHESFDLPPLTETLDSLRSAIASGPLLKALYGTRVVGAVRGRVQDRTGHIGRLAVAPDLQGLGVGTRLVVAIEEVLAPSVDRFELFTGPRSEANVRLYERLGYERIATPFGHEPLIYLAKPARPDLGG